MAKQKQTYIDIVGGGTYRTTHSYDQCLGHVLGKSPGSIVEAEDTNGKRVAILVHNIAAIREI